MKCPNCGKEMTKDFCMFCGYMSNGNYIKKRKHKATDLEKNLGDEYDTIIRNDNNLTTFILGPLYFCYRNYLFLGVSLAYLNIVCYFGILFFYQNQEGDFFTNAIGMYFLLITILLFFLLNKIFYVSFANYICLYFAKRKIKKINTKYKKQKNDYLIKVKFKNDLKLIIGIILYLSVFVILYILAYLDYI